ncbi:MAG: T9SS C-terminal target domain-containing protein [Bacteroidetes bacterium]|nr:T9SS C-terminal target domain-containing protein [Bacteroidota bacterium]
MKKTSLLIILNFIILKTTFAQTNIYDSIYVDGRWRTFLTHLPTGYNNSNQYPLVLAFHGGSPLGYQSIQYQSGLSEKADTSSFIVVYPEGTKVAGNRTWNAGGCCAPATALNIDDIGFVNSLLNTLFSTKPIDTTRVYATGFSNGALLCYRLANQLTNRFAAIAPVAGDLMYYPWNPSRSIPIISFHSYQDQNVKYFGGVTVGSTGTYFPPQDSIFKIISANYSCDIVKDTLFHNTNQYDHFKYSNCSCNAIIEQYVSYDGEHSWPGGLSSGNVKVSDQFSATYLMWQFFQNYTTSCITTGINENTEKNIMLFPNPFTNTINVKNMTGKEQFTLYNYFGQIVWSGKSIEKQDFSELTYGLYFLKVDNRTIKLVKQ